MQLVSPTTSCVEALHTPDADVLTVTPRRALFWGSVLALWGTAGVFLTAKRSLGIDSSADASDRLAAIMTPYADWFHQR